MTTRQLIKLLDNPKTPESEIAAFGTEFVEAASEYIVRDQLSFCLIWLAWPVFVFVFFASTNLMGLTHPWDTLNPYVLQLYMMFPFVVFFVMNFHFVYLKSRTARRIATARIWLTMSQNRLDFETAIRVIVTQSMNTSEQLEVTKLTMLRFRDLLTTKVGSDFLKLDPADRTRMRSMIVVTNTKLQAAMNIEILRILGEARDRFSRANIEVLTKKPVGSLFEQEVKEKARWVMETYFNYPVDQDPAEMLLRSSDDDTGESVLLRPAGSVDTETELLLRPSDREGPP